MATKKYRIQQLQSDESLLVLHPETDASVVKVDNSKTGTTAKDVESAIKELKDSIQETANEIKDGVVTGIKGSNEIEYRKGQVIISKENIGLSNVNNVAITKSEVEQITTNKDNIINILIQIDNIKKVLSSDDVDFDTLQELVNALKNNVSSINDIFTELANKIDKDVYDLFVLNQSNKDKSQDELINSKQDQLESGLNIKTYNGQSILGSGNIEPPSNVESSNKLSNARNISLSNDMTGSASFDGSKDITITTTLKDVGEAGTYSVVQTDTKGRVIAGGQLIEVGATGVTTPSETLVNGGIFFQEI